ncbi:hypothetical protein TW95_gp0326 [Pandoravirus inopinatum]|uniref:Uncharacterized protein n=1 Tax=Pandoravirus inopinatum TaxID=1605721 RepID=A0A0B5J5U1_9VIRU|nr:hypothetical protein TW95_gp0326 [Pandoravirus inopinatum]AJF97060.1 hypothetical protein [Pandoravirus inopinatum]
MARVHTHQSNICAVQKKPTRWRLHGNTSPLGPWRLHSHPFVVPFFSFFYVAVSTWSDQSPLGTATTSRRVNAIFGTHPFGITSDSSDPTSSSKMKMATPTLFGTPLVLVALCATALLCMAASVDAKTCTFQKCFCTTKDCDAFSSCTTHVQEEGACGSDNMICNCSTNKILKYANSGCTGSVTSYTSGSCYSKTFCMEIISCV